MARYHVLHETHYDYGGTVSLSQQMLHLVPRPSDWQECIRYELTIEPEPSWRASGHDAFGNPVEWLAFNQPHNELHVRSEMEVDVRSHGMIDLTSRSPGRRWPTGWSTRGASRPGRTIWRPSPFSTNPRTCG
jgi:transglutaminase-like putative cysteine protease